MKLAENYKSLTARLSPRQRQSLNLGLVAAGGFGVLWSLLSLADTGAKPQAIAPPLATAANLTNLGVMAPGSQVSPQDLWVGTAGRKLAQYEQDKQVQERTNADRKSFEDAILKRLGEMEGKLVATGATAMPPNAPPVAPPANAIGSAQVPLGTPGRVPAGPPPSPDFIPDEAATMTRIALAVPERAATSQNGAAAPGTAHDPSPPHVDNFLPIGFARADLLGGMDAPTGGQAQNNPHPVLFRLSDTAVLPNRYRGEVKECFVIGAGYGDVSSERAYIRTELLSCVRKDGSVLEVRIQGSVFGEDGKAGMRGRLVTKQGQILANALLAGIVGGIGQGFANSGTTVTTSALGTIATQNGDMREQMRRGIGAGTGRALDHLAQYYIKLAEQTFPVIEIDAGRQVDVVITRGVRIDGAQQNGSLGAEPKPQNLPSLASGGSNGQE